MNKKLQKLEIVNHQKSCKSTLYQIFQYFVKHESCGFHHALENTEKLNMTKIIRENHITQSINPKTKTT